MLSYQAPRGKGVLHMEQAAKSLEMHVGSWMLSSRALQRRKGMSQMEATMYIQQKHAKMEVQPSLLIGLKKVYMAFSTVCTCDKAH